MICLQKRWSGLPPLQTRLHLQEQFARRSWADREQQKQLRAAMRSERDSDSEDEEE